MSKSQTVFSLRLDESMYEKIRLIADDNRRSINAEILVVLEKHVTDYERTHGAIKIKEL
jgi:hypothetical protein